MSDPASRRQRFELGYQTICWDLRGHSVSRALDVLAGLGFKWFESLLDDTLGGDYARRRMTLGHLGTPRVVTDYEMFDRLAFVANARETHGVRPASVYVDGEWVNPRLWPHELAKAQVVMRFLASVGAPIFVCGGGPPERDAKRTKADYREFCNRLAEIGRQTAELGIRTAYHPHLDTFVETRAQLDKLMEELDSDQVGLCIDPAHFQAHDDDPVQIFKDFAAQIDYVHLKDWKPTGTSLGHDRYVGFCELGEGIIDLRGIVTALFDADYDGLVVVELDYAEDPDSSAARNAEYLRQGLNLEIDLN